MLQLYVYLYAGERKDMWEVSEYGKIIWDCNLPGGLYNIKQVWSVKIHYYEILDWNIQGY